MRLPLRRGALLPAGLATVLAAAAAAGWLNAPAGAAPPAAGRSQTANRRAAAGDALRRLAATPLPVGARRLDAEPAGDQRTLSRPALAPAGVRLVDRHGWWTVPEPPRAVSRYLRAHVPAGAMRTGTGSSAGGGAPAVRFVSYRWPPVGGVLGQRQLVMELVLLPGGVTGMRADAEVQWIVPRPAAERIPARARVLNISLSGPGRRRLAPATVTSRRKVHAVAAAIDRLPIAQPGAVACPLILTQPMVTFTFRAARSGPALAQARVLQDPTAAAGPCAAMSLAIRGHEEPALTGGAAVIRVARRLGL